MARNDNGRRNSAERPPVKISARIAYLAVRSLIGVIGRIPRVLAYGFCETCGLLVYCLDRKHRKIGMTNLAIAFPDRDERWRRSVLRSSFLRIADHFVELCHLPEITTREIGERVVYEPGCGLENYEAAKKLGKGVMFLTGHTCAWELLPLAQAALRNPLGVVVRPLDNPLLDRWLTATRSRFGNKVIEKESALRRILRFFSEDEDVGILIDQNVQEKDGLFVPLFGQQACTTASPATLALRTGTPVVFAFLIPRKRKGHYRIRFYPPIELDPSEDRKADLVKYTALFNRYIEEIIRENPDCWLWGHRRFRTQPDGSDPYSG